jgi:thiosulfate reductase cytochrome b subunit
MLDKQAGAGWQRVHPLVVRITHWVNALAILMMVTSGWRIYDASPLFDFRFPSELTIGGWLGGAIAWHFAAMWLLAANGLVYLVYGFISGHFRRSFLPLTVAGVVSDLKAALTFRLAHRLGHYNAVQRLLYGGVIALIIVLVLSGLAIWKPVQMQALAAVLGGYEGARRVHFLAMSGIVAFVVVHLVLVALVPKTLVPMITGRARSGATESETTP